jgi:prefoldin subunit 4
MPTWVNFSRYRVGESYLHMPQARAMKRLEKDQSNIDDQISKLTSSLEECEKGMKQLKVVLYAKFGGAINLDE